jgi:hypothetical protein
MDDGQGIGRVRSKKEDTDEGCLWSKGAGAGGVGPCFVAVEENIYVSTYVLDSFPGTGVAAEINFPRVAGKVVTHAVQLAR